jgi:hypothetical protein
MLVNRAGLSTADNRSYMIRRFIRPAIGDEPLNSLTSGLRWAEAIGLELAQVHSAEIHVEWQFHELNGKFHRLPPKDDSYRSPNWEPKLPVDLPPFLADLIERQAKTHPTACWLPIKTGLTPHGLRHSHKTYQFGIPEILAEQRLRHQAPGMRALYAHASPRMRDDLKQALEERWKNHSKPGPPSASTPQCRYSIALDVPAALPRPDAILCQRTTSRGVADLITALGLPASIAPALQRMPDDVVAVATAGSVQFAGLAPHQSERAALSQSLRQPAATGA